jgi:hypothetical protein
VAVVTLISVVLLVVGPFQAYLQNQSGSNSVYLPIIGESSTGSIPPIETSSPSVVPRFGLFERSFVHSGSYANPYTELSPTAAFTRPDGTQWTIPLFWDGEQTWKVRISPDVTGVWSYATSSSDAGLNNQSGHFTVTPSSNKGGIQPMVDFPYHFQYQDGTPFWFLGDTQWAGFLVDNNENINRATMQHYIDERASQGINFVLSVILHDRRNSGGVPTFYAVSSESMNPSFFQEVDARVAYMNDKGIVSGVTLAWATDPIWNASWETFSSDTARLRFTRYVVARYSAYKVLFIVAGEWNESLSRADVNMIGTEIADTDPHDRMVTVHPGGNGSVESFADESWMSLGDFQQLYRAPNTTEATDDHRDDLRQGLLAARDHSKPVINSEYAYYLRDSNGDGVVDKPHSHSRASFRRASWVLAMAGGYFVTGFGTTYFGGYRDPGLFNVDATKNDEAEADIARIGSFFTDLEWWRLQPNDSLAGSAEGYRYVLADPGNTYVVYTVGTTSASLSLGQGSGGSYTVRRYDPRSGEFSDQPDHSGSGPIPLSAPDNQDWIFLIQSQ